MIEKLDFIHNAKLVVKNGKRIIEEVNTEWKLEVSGIKITERKRVISILKSTELNLIMGLQWNNTKNCI